MFKYEELYDNLKTAIETGEIAPGEKLPSEANLCERGFSRNTVRQALALLEQDGLIAKRHGSGSVVKPPSVQRKMTGNVALLFTSFVHYIFNDTLNGINDGLHGWAAPMLYSSGAKIEEEERILKEMLEKRPDGLIVQAFNTALPNPNIALYQKLIDNGIPVIFLYGFYKDLNNFLYVAHDDNRGAEEAVRYLYEQGHRHLGGIFVTEEHQFHRRFKGYCAECRRLGIPLLSENVFWISSTTLHEPKRLREDIEKIQRMATDCDALVCTSDYLSEVIVNTLVETNVRIPEDVAVISFDNSYLCDYAQVPITSMDCRPYEVGRIAAQKLKSVLSGNKETSEELTWQLVKRKSS